MICTPCEDQDGLFSMKGGGKGGFQKFDGYCDCCGAYGHRKRDCNKLTTYLQSMGKGYKGQGTQISAVKGGELMNGGDSKGGKTSYSTGGWQQKGGFSRKGQGNLKGGWPGKGYRPFFGKGGKQTLFNIDADPSENMNGGPTATHNEPYYSDFAHTNSWNMFACMYEDSDRERDAEDDDAMISGVGDGQGSVVVEESSFDDSVGSTCDSSTPSAAVSHLQDAGEKDLTMSSTSSELLTKLQQAISMGLVTSEITSTLRGVRYAFLGVLHLMCTRHIM